MWIASGSGLKRERQTALTDRFVEPARARRDHQLDRKLLRQRDAKRLADIGFVVFNDFLPTCEIRENLIVLPYIQHAISRRAEPTVADINRAVRHLRREIRVSAAESNALTARQNLTRDTGYPPARALGPVVVQNFKQGGFHPGIRMPGAVWKRLQHECLRIRELREQHVARAVGAKMQVMNAPGVEQPVIPIGEVVPNVPTSIWDQISSIPDELFQHRIIVCGRRRDLKFPRLMDDSRRLAGSSPLGIKIPEGIVLRG